MSNQIKGTIIKLLQVQRGTGKNGEWIKQEFIVETSEQYPKKVCITAWGNHAANLDSYSIGEKVTVSINLESREYNEKWYTEIKMWKMERDGGSESQESTKQENFNQDIQSDVTTFSSNNGETDDLPFN